MNGIVARPAPSLPSWARSNMMAFPETDAAAAVASASARGHPPRRRHRHMAIQPAKRKALRIQRTNDLQAAASVVVFCVRPAGRGRGVQYY